MKLSLRIEDKTAASLDAAAAAQGLTRSRYIARLIERDLDGVPASKTRWQPRQTGRRKQIALRLDEAEIADIDRAASQLGMRRSQWVATRIRGGLIGPDGSVMLSPISGDALGKIIAQIIRVGRNVNQAVHAVNSSVMPDSALDLKRCAEQLTAMRDDVLETVEEAERSFLEVAIAEQRYWKE